MTLARQLAWGSPQQVFGETPAVLADALIDGVNLAAWQRQLPSPIAQFAGALLALDVPLSESLTVEPDASGIVSMPSLAAAYRGITGHSEFVADVTWLVSAFRCLLEARRIGVRLRVLDKPMCPRFHFDHVPLRLITTYAGPGSEWLREDAMPRHRLGEPAAEPHDSRDIQQLLAGEVALFKGEKWAGNEGAGIIHRSPLTSPANKRLILTLDWLA
jgi:hypothetical protein